MKGRPKFDIEKCMYKENTVFISKLLDPCTVKIARLVYNLGLSANMTTLITFIFGISSIASLFLIPGYFGLIISAILLTIRNIGDTIDGKIARGSNTSSAIGGFADLVSDWIFFHAAFFIAIGFLTNHVAIGFLCVTGYMSREFTRRQFTNKYGAKITETNEAKSMPWVVSIVKKYDLASAFWLIPILLILNQPAIIIYAIAVIEYALLLGEMGFDVLCLIRKK